ncbi:MAG: hypothetical protein QM775_24175 [Pirellulales bacterium]
MAYLIGTDEAGYGPNLGPLVISATLWRVPDDAVDTCLYELLKKSVTSLPRKSKQPDRRVWLADSKVVYSSTAGLAALERGVRAVLACCGIEGRTLHDLLEALDDGSRPTRRRFLGMPVRISTCRWLVQPTTRPKRPAVCATGWPLPASNF